MMVCVEVKQGQTRAPDESYEMKLVDIVAWRKVSGHSLTKIANKTISR
jgi:hypothetical protein